MRALYFLMLAFPLAVGCDRKEDDDKPDAGDEADTGTGTDTGTETDTETDTGSDTGSPPIDADTDGVEASKDCDDADPTLGAIADDRDCDRLSDADEYVWGSDPDNPDTDGDWLADGDDIEDGRSPTTAERVRITLNEADTKRIHLIGVAAYRPVNIAFLFDTTPDPDALHAVRTHLSEIVERLTERLPQNAMQYGLASYDDYAFSTFGYASSGDHPFTLHQQMTADISAVQAGLDGLSTHFGGDAADGAMEALYQSLTGAGYDQNCDGLYDPSTDVLPFTASASDPFSGTAGGSATEGGVIGGLGFRPHAHPIIIYITDNPMRDPDEGDPTPGGCPLDAGGTDVAAAASAIDATLVGIGWGSLSTTSDMEALAWATDSVTDTDGDGTADAPLAYRWTGGASGLRDTIVDATQAAASLRTGAPAPFTFSEVVPFIAHDDREFVSGITPSSFTELDAEEDAPVTLRLALDLQGTAPASSSTTVYEFTLVLIGESGPALGRLPIEIRVPGTPDG